LAQAHKPSTGEPLVATPLHPPAVMLPPRFVIPVATGANIHGASPGPRRTTGLPQCKPNSLNALLVSPAHSPQQHVSSPPSAGPTAEAMTSDTQEWHDVPWMAQEAQLLKRQCLGLDTPSSLAFMDSNEFISLGCFCGVACALQTMGLHRKAYPFDWLRSDLRGVMHCLEANFEDFLTFKSVRQVGQNTVYAHARWGGSFWHHNVEDDKVYNDMTRRAERLLGMGEISPFASRVFVCGLNASCDVNHALDLKDALRRVLPECSFKLLFVIDCQKKKGAMRLKGPEGEDILFYQIDELVYNQAHCKEQIDIRSEPYEEAIAFAIKFWSGELDARMAARVLPNLVEIAAVCDQWHGGDPGCDLFHPEGFRGRRMTVGNAPSNISKLIAERIGHFQLPPNFVVGGKIQTDAWGTPLLLQLPPRAVAGQTVELRLVDGIVKTTLLAMTATTVSAAATSAVQTLATSELVLQRA